MGKNAKKRKVVGDRSASPNKRARQRHWIESSGCAKAYNRENLAKNACVTIEVTRVELVDDLLLNLSDMPAAELKKYDYKKNESNLVNVDESEIKERTSCNINSCHEISRSNDSETIITEETQGGENTADVTLIKKMDGAVDVGTRYIENELTKVASSITSPTPKPKVQIVRSQSAFDCAVDVGIRYIENELTKVASSITPTTPKPKVQIVRSQSALGNVKWNKNYKKCNSFKDLPNGDCGDGVLNPHPETEVHNKYWAQRRRLFSRFDHGIKLDPQGWYSTTPEVIADHTSHRAVEMANKYPSEKKNKLIVLDAFCGCGGNSIAFAKNENISLVIAIDNDPLKIKMAKHNALIYEIPKDKIIFLEADAIEVMSCYHNGSLSPQHSCISNAEDKLPTHIDIVFLSPPWGGPEYLQKQSFNFALDLKFEFSAARQITNGSSLLQIAAKTAKNQMVILFLPRNTNGTKLGKSASFVGYEDGSIIEMEQNVVNGKLKAITAYFGKQVDSV